jgi:hypothetical protein
MSVKVTITHDIGNWLTVATATKLSLKGFSFIFRKRTIQLKIKLHTVKI